MAKTRLKKMKDSIQEAHRKQSKVQTKDRPPVRRLDPNGNPLPPHQSPAVNRRASAADTHKATTATEPAKSPKE